MTAMGRKRTWRHAEASETAIAAFGQMQPGIVGKRAACLPQGQLSGQKANYRVIRQEVSSDTIIWLLVSV